MRNFQLIHKGLDIVPIMNEIIRNEHLWNENTLRTDHKETAHSEVDDIWLRFNDLNECENTSDVIDDRECINYPAIWTLTHAKRLIHWLSGRVEGERLGRCLITRLPPGKKIDLHEDGGAPADYYERYHIVLQSFPGNIFKCGEEAIQMQTGEVWWFDNKLEHEIINNSADDRIHLIIDIRTSH